MIVAPSVADVVVTHEASDPEEEKMAPLYGLIKYSLTVTDRRDGVKLATMDFAVDMAKGHACGAERERCNRSGCISKAGYGHSGQSKDMLPASDIQDVSL